MEFLEHKNIGFMMVKLKKDDVGKTSVICKVPVEARVTEINLTVDEAFTGTNTLTLGVFGKTSKFFNAASLATIGGVNSQTHHSAGDTDNEIIMSLGGNSSTAGSATLGISYVLPSKYVVNY
jgi:hypothetical protein